MLKEIFIKTWIFLKSLPGILVLLTLVFILIFSGIPKSTAQTDPYEKYEPAAASLKEAIASYHANVNEIFNQKIELLMSGKGENEVDLECPEENISTYCLATRVVAEYQGFEKALLEHSQYVTDTGDTEESEFLTLEELTEEAKQRQDLIPAELMFAKKAIDQTLAAYNELYAAYTFHQKYEDLIRNLEKYRDGLVEIRKRVEVFPDKFIDASTTKCT